MPIRIDKFGGLVPALAPDKLPDNAAQIAHNVDLTRGSLVPINVTDPFSSMHEADGELKVGIPTADVKNITKPTAPSVSSRVKMCDPTRWLEIYVFDWISWINPATGSREVYRYRNTLMPISQVIHHEAGMYLISYLTGSLYYFLNGGPYFLRGPRYAFRFRRDNGGIYGGPDQAIDLPSTPTEADSEFPLQKVPLINSLNNAYAFFQCVDIQGPRYDEDILVTDYPQISMFLPNNYLSAVVFHINLNYAEASRKHYYYVTTGLTGADEEGPPSALSSRIFIRPGERLRLNTPIPSGCNSVNLYRSTTGGDDFKLVKEVGSNGYWDDKANVQAVEIPPYGNPPASNSAFLEGSSVHPANFGVAFYKKTLYFSDFFRLHAWPDEFTLPFPDGIKAIALTGNTVLVFSGEKVYGVSGSNPEAMSRALLSETAPLLTKQSLCKIGQSIFWSTHDGMAVSNGGEPKIVTSKHFTRRQWLEYKPETMVATTADNSIFLETVQGNVRIDLEDEVGAVSTYDGVQSTSMRWKSKLFRFDEPVTFDCLRLNGESTATVKLYADGVLAATKSLVAGSPHYDVTLPSVKKWEFEISGSAEVSSLEAIERSVQLVNDSINLTSQNVPAWGAVWLKFLDIDRFAVGSLTLNNQQTASLSFYVDEVLVHTVDTDGKGIFTFPRDLPKASLWRMSVAGAKGQPTGTSKDVLPGLDMNPFKDVSPEYASRIQQLYGPGMYFYQNQGGLSSAAQSLQTQVASLASRAPSPPRGPSPRPYGPLSPTGLPAIAPEHMAGLFLSRRTTQSIEGSLRELNTGPFAPWLAKRYEFVDKAKVTSIIVNASAPVTMNLYYDGAVTPTTTVAVADGSEIRVDASRYSSVEFDFGGSDALVNEVILLAQKPQLIGPDGIQLNNPPFIRHLLYKFPDRGRFAWLSLGASDYTSIIVNLYADGVLVLEQPVTTGNVLLLPRTLPDAALWEVDVVTTAEVTSLLLHPRVPVDVQSPSIDVLNPDTVAPWLHTRYEFPTRRQLTSVFVHADAEVSMRLFLDGSAVESQVLVLTPNSETLVSSMPWCTSVEFEFIGADYTVNEVSLFTHVVTQVGNEAITIGSRPNYRMLAYQFPDKNRFAGVSVAASNYEALTLRLYADYILVEEKAIESGAFVQLRKDLPTGYIWHVDIEQAAGHVVHGAVLTPVQLVSAPEGVALTNSANVPTWLFTEFQGIRNRLKSVTVQSSTYPLTMRVYLDAETGPSTQITVEDGLEIPIDLDREPNLISFDFNGNDSSVRSVVLLTEQEPLIADQGITMVNPRSWRRIRARFANTGSFSCGSIGCTDSLTLTLTADGDEVYSETISDGEMFLFPKNMGSGTVWEIDIETEGIVRSLVMLPYTRVAAQGDIHVLGSETGLPSWLPAIYDLPDALTPRSVVVRAVSYPVTMRLFKNSDTSPTQSIVVRNANEIRLGLTSLTSSTGGTTSISGARMRGTVGTSAPVSDESSGSGGYAAVTSSASGVGTFSDRWSSIRFDFNGDDNLVKEARVFIKEQPTIAAPVRITTQTGLRGNAYRFAMPNAFVCGYVSASSYTDMVVTFYADGEKVHSQKVKGADPFKLPIDIPKALVWEVDIACSDEVYDAVFYPLQSAPIDGVTIRSVRQNDAIPAWWHTEFVLTPGTKLRSGRVYADRYAVPLTLYFDGDTSVTKKVSVQNDREFLIENVDAGSVLRFDFGTKDEYVKDVYLWAEETVAITNSGLVIRDGNGIVPWRNKVARFPDVGSFAVGRIVAEDYDDMQIELDAGGSARTVKNVSNSGDFKFPIGLRAARDWNLDIEHAGKIHELILIGRESVPIKDGIAVLRRGDEPFSWLAKRVISPKPINFSCVKVVSDEYPVTFKLYSDNVLMQTLALFNGNGVRLPRLAPQREWMFDVVASSWKVVQEVMVSTNMEAMSRV